jgi:hypothetical protein
MLSIATLIVFTGFAALGLFLLAAQVIGIPTLAKAKSVMALAKMSRAEESEIQNLILYLSAHLARAIRLEGYKKKALVATLKSAGITMTPETYIAKAYIKAAGIMLLVIPTYIVFPFILPLVVLLSILSYFKERQSAENIVQARRDQIEDELPRLVATISENLSGGHRNVLAIFEKYRETAGDALAGELDITIADMKTSGDERALVRFEARVASAMLSAVIRGLVGVLRGDNDAIYFQILAHDFKQIEIARLKRIAARRPAQIRKYSFFMLTCFVLMYLVVFAVEILTQVDTLF